MKGESLLSGDFGESFVAYLLAKEGVDVVRAKTVGFDLFAVDHGSRILPRHKLAGISAKTTVSKEHAKFAPTIPLGSENILEAERIWGVEPWLALVVGSIGRKLACFLLPFSERQKFTGRARRYDVVAVSQPYRDVNIVKRLF